MTARPHVSVACQRCKKSHIKCQQERPCEKCRNSGEASNCKDALHKVRGRPRKPCQRFSRRPNTITSVELMFPRVGSSVEKDSYHNRDHQLIHVIDKPQSSGPMLLAGYSLCADGTLNRPKALMSCNFIKSETRKQTGPISVYLPPLSEGLEKASRYLTTSSNANGNPFRGNPIEPRVPSRHESMRKQTYEGAYRSTPFCKFILEGGEHSGTSRGFHNPWLKTRNHQRSPSPTDIYKRSTIGINYGPSIRVSQPQHSSTPRQSQRERGGRISIPDILN